MLELLVPDEPPAEELDAKPEYCGFQRFTANWCAADTDRTLGEKNMELNKKTFFGVNPMQVSPGKGKLGEGVGCEVADGRVGQELHHLQVSRRSEKVNTKVSRKRESE